jgi:hypothetical protein
MDDVLKKYSQKKDKKDKKEQQEKYVLLKKYILL